MKIMNKLSYYLDITHISISNYISHTLIKLSIPFVQIELNMTDPNLFKPVDKVGKNIFIYNGFNKGNSHIYGEKIYIQVVNILKEKGFKFIYSNELNKPYEQMSLIYSKCFIGLRLTEYDGNANTVQEFNCMGIPIIFNGTGGIKWAGCDDIVKTIKKIYNKTFKLIDY